MAGWGHCKRCSGRVWWGTSPFNPTKVWPFDDDDENTQHQETCSAQKWFVDADGNRHAVSPCRACAVDVWWQTTPNGKRRPMDADGVTCHFDSCVGEPVGATGYASAAATANTRIPNVAPDRPYSIDLWLGDLGLQWPVEIAEVTTAFRKLARVHHPDMGGDPMKFIKIRLAYDRCRELLGIAV